METNTKKHRPRHGKGKPPADLPQADAPNAKNIVTKRPVWSTSSQQPAPQQAPARPPAQKSAQPSVQQPAKQQAPAQMENKGNRNKRRRGGRGKNAPAPEPGAPQKAAAPSIPKNENGIFDFSEAELAEDSAIKLISRTNTEVKYASFEDFLKDH